MLFGKPLRVHAVPLLLGAHSTYIFISETRYIFSFPFYFVPGFFCIARGQPVLEARATSTASVWRKEALAGLILM